MLIAASPAWLMAQDFSSDPVFDELRRRTPSGQADDETIDNWIKTELSALVAADEPVDAGGALRTKLDALMKSDSTSPLFKETFYRRLNLLAKGSLAESPPWPVQSAVELTRTLAAMGSLETIDALGQAMQSEAGQVRYLAARTLLKMRDAVTQDPNRLTIYVNLLREAGVKEESGVVSEQIYGGLSISGNAEAVDAIAAILTARVDKYRNGARFDDSAETVVCEFLQNEDLSQAKAVEIVQALAVIVRLDIERYAVGRLQHDEQFAIELRVDRCEKLLEKLTRSNGEGKLSSGMQSGAVSAELKLDLLEWIGSESTAGRLNTAPWGVPKGAP